MECKTVDEIVNINSNDKSPDDIAENFLWIQEKWYGNEISERQKENIYALSKLLYYKNNDDVKVPIIANVPMGEGKSCLLVEFMKYLYDADPEFGAIVVKKTLEECHDFCIDMGLTDKTLEEYGFDNDRQALKQAYYSYIDGKEVKFNDGVDYVRGQIGFIARTVRGFNFTDCRKYEDRSKQWWFGSPPPDVVYYDYRLCHDCKIQCLARKSKAECKKHRILAISHTRLFLSNYIDEFFEDIMCFEHDGKEIKRKLLIIDEKIDMCDISSITDTNFKKLKELIIDKFGQYEELFKEITEYIDSLEYPAEMNKPVIKQTKLFRDGKGFQFDEELLKAFYNDTSIEREKYENLLDLGKILNSKNITTGIPYRFGDSKARAEKENRKLTREIYAYRYLDLSAYNKKFDKTIILDATADLDYDYLKSNAVICDDIYNEKREINVYIPYRDANTSKGRLLKTGDHNMKAEDRKCFYSANIKNLALECKQIMESENKKTLIVVFKEVTVDKTYDFKEDISEELEKICEGKDYTVIHHGEFTTGVNKFSDCERIIIIGQLNKSSSFYQNKCLAVGRKIDEDDTHIQHVSHTEMNDYLISNIQQIGRTAYRKKELVDVYFVGRLKVLEGLISELGKYFNVNMETFENIYYYKEPTKQELLIEKILTKYIWSKEGETIKKQEIEELCEEIKMDKSAIRKPSFKEKLKQIGIITNPDNNREYLFTKDM
ncbi:hypothetical protein [Dehalobacter sp. TeCB1]|uniref:hypothetical protein n=1 Tax=Dehalobacter sp. TeCB1 TaxID=1843715 RepID=UPI00083A8CA2|nr:hypothetical protein [Dehalobacter sp. TeCB1]OCZ50592.1 hypothetical protein A7D23_14550 [Dehalobacter sp. TeCB1]